MTDNSLKPNEPYFDTGNNSFHNVPVAKDTLVEQIAKLQAELEASKKKFEEFWDEQVCPLCYRLNPQHETMDDGKGCHWCVDKDRYVESLK